MDNQNKVNCPDCGKEIVCPEGVTVGEILECGECGTEVEVVTVKPVTVRELIEEK